MEYVPPSDLSSWFSLVSSDLWQDEGWTMVQNEEASALGINVSRRADSPGVLLVRGRYEIDATPHELLTLFRPEVFHDPRRPEFGEEMAACGIEQVVAPGDAFGWVRLVPHGDHQQFVRQSIILQASAEQSQRILRDGNDDFLFFRRGRRAVRRDFPELGTHVAVVIPLHSETNDLAEEWGVMKASVAVFEPHREPGKSSVIEVKRFTQGSTWALPKLKPRIFSNFKFLHFVTNGFRASTAFADAAMTYLVLTLRKCTRGPPLLPLGSGSTTEVDQWQQAEKYELPNYLRTFLACIDVTDIEVYDSLDGRRLLPYQAAMSRSSWERAWNVLQEPFQRQRAAYRRLLGGQCAPQLRVDDIPRFVPLDNLIPGPYTEVRTVDAEHCQIPVQQTFIHFKEPPGLGRLRCNSASEFEHSADVYL